MASVDRRVTRGTLAAQLEGALRDAIVSGELAPGTRLRAEDVAQRYGVSHTPIREALRSLAADGLIQLDPRLGAEVARISIADLRDVYRLRMLLEGEALESSIQNADAAWDADLRLAMERLSEVFGRRTWPSRRDAGLARSEAHAAFDAALFSACGSPWLLRFVTTMSAHSERYRWALRSMHGIDRDLEAEHRAIADAALSRDVVGAREALVAHLRKTLEIMELSLEESSAAVAPARSRSARS